MPFPSPGSGDGGGQGFALGPASNSFGSTTTTRPAAEAARNAYANANADWLAEYNANRSNYIRLLWTGNAVAFQRRNAAGDAWEDVTGVVTGPTGPGGLDGAPGGGAIEAAGMYDGTAPRGANVFVATGLMLGERGDTPFVLYRLVPNTLVLLWFDTDALYGIATAAAGDTGTDGSAGPPVVARTRLRLPESAGSSVSGSLDAGLTAENELLLSTTSSNVDITVEFFRYIPSALQGGGLSDEDRLKLDGVETGATADQTGAEIKAAYEGEANTNWVRSVTGSGSTITVTRRDGTATQHTFPMGGEGGGGGSDGVLDEAPVFDEAAQTVTFHISTGVTFTLNLADLVTQTELDAAIAGLENQTDAQVKASYEANPDTNAFSDAQETKLAGVAGGANNLIPYKLGNIYRAFAAGAAVVKPGNDEGEVTVAGIGVAPVDWLLARPEATAALPFVYDCHVYGYGINGVFSVQYGTPNRTDRYIGAAAPSDDLYFGTSVDEIPEPAEATIEGVSGRGTIPVYVGVRHHLIFQLASEEDITSAVRSDDSTSTNLLAGFTKFDSTVIPAGETEPFAVWVSNQALSNDVAFDWIVA